jgi:hypothetical protein
MTTHNTADYPRCKTCTFWGDYREGVCDFSDSTQATRFVIHAEAADDSGLEAWLETGPDFGCVHHEAR